MDRKEMLEIRKQRGMEIARTCKITKRGSRWIVPSQSGHGTYSIIVKRGLPICDCPDCQSREIKCKHIWAVEMAITKQIDQKGNVTVTKRLTYSQNWEAYDQAQTKQKGMFMELLNDLCGQLPKPTYSFGRPRMPLGDMVFASALKVFTTFSLRRFATDMQTAKEKGLIDRVPHYSTVALYMEDGGLTPILKELIKISALPLRTVESDFAVDASGFGTTRFERWTERKYGGRVAGAKKWLKAHVMSGTKTGIVSAVDVSVVPEHEVKYLQPLLQETAENFDIKELSADKAYNSHDNMDAVNRVGAVPFIPYKRNTRARANGSSTWHKMWYYFMYRHEEFLEHYHKRSKAETTFHMIKSKFGDSLRSKTETAQINEILLKVLCHNICVVISEMHELGIEPNFKDSFVINSKV
jgi:transposase